MRGVKPDNIQKPPTFKPATPYPPEKQPIESSPAGKPPVAQSPERPPAPSPAAKSAVPPTPPTPIPPAHAPTTQAKAPPTGESDAADAGTSKEEPSPPRTADGTPSKPGGRTSPPGGEPAGGSEITWSPAGGEQSPTQPKPKKEGGLREQFFGKKKKTKPTLEPLEETEKDKEDFPSPAEETEPGGKSPVMKLVMAGVVFIILIAVGGVVILFAYPYVEGHVSSALASFTKPAVLYQCYDGKWVMERSMCPTTTTLKPTVTTQSTLPPLTLPTNPTTTTTLEVRCYNTSMCEEPIPYRPFCDDRFVKTPDVKFTCIHPGTPDSYCKSVAVNPRLVKTCEDSEYCYAGECYPDHCRNDVRDYERGEVWMDCGGPCPPCDENDTMCLVNEDCGVDVCGAPYCNHANNPSLNCTRNICENPGEYTANCTVKDTVEVIEVCDQWEVCIEGQDDCMGGLPGQGNCYDCIQNQGELGIDCGGPCKTCASKPPQYDILNLTATDVIEYQSFKLKLDRIVWDRQCYNGAWVRIWDPYDKSQRFKVSFWENAEYWEVKFGVIDIDSNSLRVWITKEVVV
ncbi:MAG: hypothetical protein GF416_04885 [Candidatus Altiarchaeales archaeon]|nr:hypothetical protein [Candidatus Altiarchaeales archaeon]MBD3416455.1 hypothetical protein [Candidatus Altiarchaeales archaeon]